MDNRVMEIHGSGKVRMQGWEWTGGKNGEHYRPAG